MTENRMGKPVKNKMEKSVKNKKKDVQYYDDSDSVSENDENEISSAGVSDDSSDGDYFNRVHNDDNEDSISEDSVKEETDLDTNEENDDDDDKELEELELELELEIVGGKDEKKKREDIPEIDYDEIDDDDDEQHDEDSADEGIEIDDDDENNQTAECSDKVTTNPNVDIVITNADNSQVFANLEPITLTGDEVRSRPVLTKAEKTVLIGTRALYLKEEAIPFIGNTDDLTEEQIATLEFENGLIAFDIIRRDSNKVSEIVNPNELLDIHIVTDPFYKPENIEIVDGIVKKINEY